MCEAAWERFSKKQKLEEIVGNIIDRTKEIPVRNNMFYDAPTVIFVSHRKQSLQPDIEWANVRKPGKRILHPGVTFCNRVKDAEKPAK